MQRLRSPPQANQELAPSGRVPHGRGERVCLAPGHPFGGEDVSCGNALAHQDPQPPGRRIPDAPPPPPPPAPGAPQKVCRPKAAAWARITCYATTVRRVLESSTTSAGHSATVCHCMCRDVTLACATRSGPGWGCTPPQRSSRRGGGSHRHPIKGGGGRATVTPAGGGGEYTAHPQTQLPAAKGREGRGQREGSMACLQVSRCSWARPARCTEAR